MIYALVHYPAINIEQINQLRRKFDPQFDLIGPHLTMVFPVSETIGEQTLVDHIETVLLDWELFPIHLKGLEKSWDDCLFLTLEEGSVEIGLLHEALYTGVLAHYREKKIRFVPHMTLGVFTGDLSRYSQALKEAQQLALDYRCVLDKVHLVKVNDERTRIVESREFLLTE